MGVIEIQLFDMFSLDLPPARPMRLHFGSDVSLDATLHSYSTGPTVFVPIRWPDLRTEVLQIQGHSSVYGHASKEIQSGGAYSIPA